jgi:glycosyltransferase involved in cell wall biosynthesis
MSDSPGDAVEPRGRWSACLPVTAVEGVLAVPAAPALIETPLCEVHVLLCSADPEAALEAPPVFGEDVVVHRLDDLVPAEALTLQRFGGDDPELVLGESILAALIQLQPEHRFRLVLFASCGPAMRVVQAKRNRALPADLTVAVELGEPSFWSQANGTRPRTGPRDLKLDHGERSAFAGADVQIALAPAVLAAARAAEWKVADDVVTDDLDGPGYLERLAPPAQVEVGGRGSVSVAVAIAHRDHARFLPGALASIARQDRPADEVLVIDDGSTDPAALAVFAEQEGLYPGWTFVRQENTGPGGARNAGLERTDADCFLPFDSDNLAAPDMVERLLAAMESDAPPAALTCHNLSFVDDADIATGRFRARYSPTGGPRVLGCVENVYGDTCSIFDAAVLRAVGGFETGYRVPSEDWQTFAKLTARGHRIDVLPLPLYYYRTRDAGRRRSAEADPTVRPRLKALIVDLLLESADLSRLERRQLLELLQAYEAYVVDEAAPSFAEFRRWHEDEMHALHGFREAQLEELAARLQGEIEAQRERAEAAEAALALLRSRRWRRRLKLT